MHVPPQGIHHRKWNFAPSKVLPGGSIAVEFDMHTSLANTQAKLDEIERELRKYPDFQLYLLSKTGLERASREQLLRGVPGFDLWLKLRNSIALATAAL